MMTVKEFANLNSKMAEAFEQYSRTIEVYNFLVEHKGQKFTPTAIAEALGFTYHFIINGYTMDWVNYYKVVNPLYWLLEREEVKREEYKTTITVMSKGIIKEMEKTCYKWYVE